MNVFYEEDGGFKVGAILADNDSSLQVEAPHGKRSKIKATSVLMRYAAPAPAELLKQAYEHAVANMKELHDLMQKSHDDAMALLSRRFQEAMEEVKSLAGKAL